jgi:hypothetical protein
MSMSGSRSAWSAAIALALLATPTAGFLLLRPDRALERSTPRASKPALTAPAPSARRHARPLIDPSQLAAARAGALRFGGQYAAYLAGRIAAREIADAAPELIRELRRHPPRITPAQQRHRPTLRRVTVEPAAATVHAVATLQAVGAPPFQLSFVLEPRGQRWLVTRLLDA